MVRYLKKSCTSLLIVTLLFTLVPVWENVSAETTVVASGNCGDHAIWELDSDGLFTISGSGTVDLIYKQDDIAQISSQIKEINIKDGITLISSCSFNGKTYDFSSLKKVTLPKTLKTGLEDGYGQSSSLFYGCKSLETIVFEDGIENVPLGICSYCTNLKNAEIPNSITVWYGWSDDQWFNGCTELIIKSDRADSKAIEFAKVNRIAYSCPNINGGNVSIDALSYLSDASKNSPDITVTKDNTTLAKDIDYTVSFSCDTDSGKGVATITGIGKYEGTITKEYVWPTICGSTITITPTDYTADKTEKRPNITIQKDGYTLTEGTDYTLAYKNNINAGIATLCVTGTGKYIGYVEKEYTINGISIGDADVAIKTTIYTYDGSNKTPSVVVTYNGNTLVENEDYTLTYENNQDDGTAYAVVTGKGMFVDTVKKSFVILPYNSGMDSVYPDGTMISDSGVYGVTDDETNEVEYCCPSTIKTVDVKIPATITDENGTIYKVTSIGKEAFYKNTKAESVEIGNNVKSIEDYAFYGCKNLKTIKMGNGVEIIGASSFRKCTKLTSVTLPKSLNELGKNAFYGCSKLKTITIKANSVVDVNVGAIKGISKKAIIKVPKKLVKKYEKELDKKSGFKDSMNIKKIK